MASAGGGRDALRFLTCGAVDAGKSTLIGRMLYDAQLIDLDHIEDPAADSESVGTEKGGIDFALLLDGLQAEGEQGTTMVVAYRHFSTPMRKFMVADAPGDEHHTRNMAAGASTADLAVLVVDARTGIVTQTRRHSLIAGLMGIDTVILAVNKMDLVEFDQPVFERIVSDYRDFAAKIGIKHIHAIPLAALTGANVVAPSPAMPWYSGPAFLDALESIDIGPGDVMTGADHGPELTDQFAAHVIWMDEHQLIPERRYILKLGTTEVGAAVTELKYRINVDTLDHGAAKTLRINEVAFCNFSLDRPIAMDPNTHGRALGGFILMDRLNANTVGAGTIAFSLRRASNIPWQELEIGKPQLSALKAQNPAVLWLTGLSGAGKSTIANLVQKRLHALGRHTYLLDGDNLRHGLNRDLGFVEADRVENIRRVAEVAKLFVESGTIVLVSLISPYRQERAMARELVEGQEFIEIFVDTALEICEQRDPKGLYRKARAGELVNFTGIDAPYEPPVSPEIRVDGSTASPETAADAILDYLRDQGCLGAG